MIARILAFSHACRALLLALLAVFVCFPAQAKRKDVVVMNNGDHFTGEVKRLQNGLLFVEGACTSSVASRIIKSSSLRFSNLPDGVEQR